MSISMDEAKVKTLGDINDKLYSLIYEMESLVNVCEQASYSQVEVGGEEKWSGIFGIMERLVKTAERNLDQIDRVLCEAKRSVKT